MEKCTIELNKEETEVLVAIFNNACGIVNNHIIKTVQDVREYNYSWCLPNDISVEGMSEDEILKTMKALVKKEILGTEANRKFNGSEYFIDYQGILALYDIIK